MQSIIQLTNDIILEKYNPGTHSDFVSHLTEDKALTDYFKLGDELYILKYKGEYAGFYLFYRLGYLKNSITMEAGIVKELRSNFEAGKKGIGSEVLKAITEYLIANEADSIVLEIEPRNTPSIKSASKCGYLVDPSLQELFMNEGYKKTPYVIGK